MSHPPAGPLSEGSILRRLFLELLTERLARIPGRPFLGNRPAEPNPSVERAEVRLLYEIPLVVDIPRFPLRGRVQLLLERILTFV